MGKESDKKDQPCNKCHRGHYVETSIRDDWDGILHCNLCDHAVKRYSNG